MEPTRGWTTLTFLSDYGLDDEFVGVVKSVVRSIAPAVQVIDLSHNIAPHNVRAGGLTLARSAQYLVPSVVLAVVDPGVAGGRRAVAVEVGNGSAILVGPDNGLLAPAVAMVGGASRAFDISDSPVRLEAPGPTFDGRDLFAPVAAHLCLGTPLEELGQEISPGLLMPAVVPISETEGDTVVAEVLWIDRFGNVQLNIEPGELPPGRLRLQAGELTRPAQRSVAYEQVATGDIGIVIDSYGLPSLAVNRGSAAAELGIIEGDQVRLTPVEATDQNAVTTSVSLGPRPGATT